MPGARMKLGALELESLGLPIQQEGQFDLTLMVVEVNGDLCFTLDYNTDLFDAETIQRVGGHLRTLAESAGARPDDMLPAGWYRVQDHDYAGSGYDRGHMVRSEERTRSPEDNKTTFYLTNVLPQTHELNAGPWLRLEDYCQDLA